MKIEIYGSGCAKCKKTEEIVRQAVNELNIEAEISKIEDLQKIIDKGIMMTPAVAVDGEIKILGRVPSTQDVKKILQ
jgi:small redox-active disulfide protein 2